MKNIKSLFTIFLFTGTALCAMEQDPSAKRQRCITAWPEQAESVTAIAHDEKIPLEIQENIVRYLISGNLESSSLETAVNNIRKYRTLNKGCRALIDCNTVYFINELAARYTNSDSIKAAIALRTDAAGKWLAEYVNNQKELLKQTMSHLFEAIETVALNDALFLIEYIPQIRTMDKEGMNHTPLTYAAEKGLEPVVDKLLEKGVDINQLTHPEEIELYELYEDLAKPSCALAFAVYHKHKHIAQKLINAGANINLYGDPKRDYCTSILGCAVLSKDLAMLDFILSIPGVNLNQQNEFCWGTPLILAAGLGRSDQVQRLLDAGADPNFVDKRGDILTAGGKEYLEDTGMGTPLTAAVSNNKDKEDQKKMIKLLVNAGAKIDLPDQCGNTPLTYAIYKDDQEKTVTNLLLELGATVDISALFAAEETEHPKTIELIRERFYKI